MKLYQAIARAAGAYDSINRRRFNRYDRSHRERHRRRADTLVRNHLPSGAGWDLGTKLDWDRSTGERLIFLGSFHHMDEWGGYDGWTDHEIWVRPSLALDFTVDVKGRNRNDIKDYLGEMFESSLRAEVNEWEGLDG